MTSKNFESIDQLSADIISLLDTDTKGVLIHAFNATGKTRLAGAFEDDRGSEALEAISYGALFEDMFTWDNDSYVLHFTPDYSWILRTIRDEGLDGRIVDNFKRHTSASVEPLIDLTEGSINFRLSSGDDEGANGIKIARGEESLLVWSMFRACNRNTQ